MNTGHSGSTAPTSPHLEHVDTPCASFAPCAPASPLPLPPLSLPPPLPSFHHHSVLPLPLTLPTLSSPPLSPSVASPVVVAPRCAPAGPSGGSSRGRLFPLASPGASTPSCSSSSPSSPSSSSSSACLKAAPVHPSRPSFVESLPGVPPSPPITGTSSSPNSSSSSNSCSSSSHSASASSSSNSSSSSAPSPSSSSTTSLRNPCNHNRTSSSTRSKLCLIASGAPARNPVWIRSIAASLPAAALLLLYCQFAATWKVTATITCIRCTLLSSAHAADSKTAHSTSRACCAPGSQ